MIPYGAGTTERRDFTLPTKFLQLEATKQFHALSTAPVVGSSVALTAYNLENYGLSVISSSSDYRRFLLDAPEAGVRKQIYVLSVEGTTAGIAAALIYADASTVLGVYFKNSVAGTAATSNSMLTANRGSVVQLVGLSSYEWLIESETTRSSTAAISLSSST